MSGLYDAWLKDGLNEDVLNIYAALLRNQSLSKQVYQRDKHDDAFIANILHDLEGDNSGLAEGFYRAAKGRDLVVLDCALTLVRVSMASEGLRTLDQTERQGQLIERPASIKPTELISLIILSERHMFHG